ncbi:MAG: type II toxin-antitoxin system VapC family toxin [Thermoleophilia bacterium]
MIVLDTNVVSELMRAEPAAAVLTWFDAQPPSEPGITAITAAEIRYGRMSMPPGRRRDRLELNADEVFGLFPDRVLPFDGRAAAAYAEILCHREAIGRPMDGFDAQIAAICLIHGAVLATRNVRDFADTGVRVVDPWAALQVDDG